MVEAMGPEVIAKITAQIPVGRMATPDEIADAVLFLASDKSGFTTGMIMAINGGQYMTG